MGNFVLFKGIFDTMDLFTDELVCVLKKKGHTCHILNMESMDEDLKELIPFATKGIDAVISFNNIGYNLGEEEGRNLWDAFNTRYIDILMDHPFHYARTIENLPECAEIYCIDKNHVKYCERYFKDRKCFFLPHAGVLEHISSLKNVDFKNRDIDVLYAGNLSRVFIEQLIPDFGQYPEIDGVDFSQKCLSSLIENPSQTTEDVIERELKSRLGNIDDSLLEEYINGFRFLDGFAVSFFREQAVRVLVESGIQVHVLGLGWEQCDWSNNENFILEGKVDAVDVLPYMMRSKIVLNTLTWFKDGAHDRIFNGQMCGSYVVSDSSNYLLDEYENHKEIELFNLEDIMELPKIVTDLLWDSNLEAKANLGRLKAINNHSFESWLPLLKI